MIIWRCGGAGPGALVRRIVESSMSGLLYLAQVITFVLLAWNAYRAERPGAPKDGGLFGLAPDDEADESAAPAATPAWRRSLPSDVPGQPRPPTGQRGPLSVRRYGPR
jgi:hypothetical protein